MRITASQITLSSQQTLVDRVDRRESLTEGVSRDGNWEPDAVRDAVTLERQSTTPATAGPESLLDRRRGQLSLAELAQQGQARAQTGTPWLTSAQLDDLESLVRRTAAAGPPAAVEGSAALDEAPGTGDRAKIWILIATIERFTGKKLKVFSPDELGLGGGDATGSTAPPGGQAMAAVQSAYAAATPATAPAATPTPTWGLQYRYEETRYEAETTTFAAQGTVQTADGQQIAVDVNLTMGRQFVSQQTTEVRLGAAVQDPLVVNFAGTAAELSDTRYDFDLDNDGQSEQLRWTGPNSGYLAIDANGNGQVDNGSELFGPTAGDGFAELAAHDSDQNHWIDAADPVYDRLRIWSRDSAGNDQLVALGQRGVGAIYLGHVTTPFSVRDSVNQEQAQVRASGVYLREDGSAGTVQQLDLVV
jgi:hypothetical protein